MDKLLFAILASAGTAFAALAPAGAYSIDAGIKDGDKVVRAPSAWRVDASAPGCRVEMRWKRDYAGALYLKKIRVCA